jgi:hypothetical protein
MNKMDELLKKYWEGESSLEEEKFIRTYFMGDDIHPEHEQYRDLFVFFQEEASLTYPGKNEVKKRKKIHARPLLRVAAALIVLVAFAALIYSNIKTEPKDSWASYELQDTEQAREQAVAALAFVSAKLNKGEANVKNNLKTLNKLPIR